MGGQIICAEEVRLKTMIALESKLNLVRMLSVLQSNRNSIIFAVSIEIHKSRNLIGTLGSSELWPGLNRVRHFRTQEYFYKSLLTEAPSSRQRAEGNKSLLVISPAVP